MKQFANRMFTGILWRPKRIAKFFEKIYSHLYNNHWTNLVKTRKNLKVNAHNKHRKLEIGPGKNRILGFETLNIVNGPQVDYLCDASKPLPFSNNTFEIIYASHILEHIPWYLTETTLHEWVRILKPGGTLKIWIPDGLKICKAFVDAELNNDNYIDLDGWYRFNPEKDPSKWASGRLFTYGDGSGNPSHPNWHRAIFSPRYLRSLFATIGLRDITFMDSSEVIGEDHGWINLGIKGIKP